MWEAWREWKQQCAVARCSTETQAKLLAFGGARFQLYIRRYSAGRHVSPPAEPWHLFESRVTVNRTRQGKRYKDWLFARVRASETAPLDVVQAGASLIMRDATRDFLRREGTRHGVLSLDRPMGHDRDSTMTLVDLLPAALDPVSEVCLREYGVLAARHAHEFVESLSQREHVALIAKRLGLSLADPVVEESAGCKRTVLSTTFHDFVARVARRLRAVYEGEEVESVLTLALLTLQQVSGQAVEQARAQKRFGQLFLKTEDAHETAAT